LEDIISPLAKRLAEAIAEQIALTVAARLEEELGHGVKAKRPRRGSPSRRSRGREMTRWIADVRARRVPKFVIEATGLETKKKIVAKWGPNAVFEKGKPLPTPVETGGRNENPVVKARPPTIRKGGRNAA
jgi:hypothetical protein